MANTTRLLGAAALLVVGCTSATPTADPPTSAEPPQRPKEITFHVTGMNERLQILWGDWPNTVKQALAGLEGVESVEDEWERELESEESLDVLFVTHDSDRITVDKMLQTIREYGFDAEVNE